ncbi:hypothetical protein Tco_0240479, partial [Tanacetum coccineum]
MFKDNSYKAHKVHDNLFEALEKSLERDYSNQLLKDVDEARMKKRKRRTHQELLLGLLLLSHHLHLLQQARLVLQALQEHQDLLSILYLLLLHLLSASVSGIFAAPKSSPTDSLMNDDSIPDEQVQFSDDEDTGNDHLPKANKRKNWWTPLPEEERPATLEPAWTIPSSNMSDVENNWAS